MYQERASSKTPGVIIYLIDASGSMAWSLDGMIKENVPVGKRRIDYVANAIDISLGKMVEYSTDNSGKIHNRYRIALIAYSDKVYDLIGGIRNLSEVAGLNTSDLRKTFTETNTALGFEKAKELLAEEIDGIYKNKHTNPYILKSPAPLICHITDGEMNGVDAETVVNEIRTMKSVPDGHVLIENIFISHNLLQIPVINPKEWPGVTDNTVFQGKYAEYAKKLRALSSPIPDLYRNNMVEEGYKNISSSAFLMIPGTSNELIECGIVMSRASSTLAIPY